MEENRRLIILNDTFGKERSDEEIAGLTILVDGTIKIAFDKIHRKPMILGKVFNGKKYITNRFMVR